jgi:DNA-directed RNA polymerase subunit RPC12/RpoP
MDTSQKYICTYCKKKSEKIGIVQEELHYYSVDINTRQWEDFHGDEDVKSQKLFCLHCNKKIDPGEQDSWGNGDNTIILSHKNLCGN